MLHAGGGHPKIDESDKDKDLILSLMNRKTVYGLKNPYDSDGNICDPQPSVFVKRHQNPIFEP